MKVNSRLLSVGKISYSICSKVLLRPLDLNEYRSESDKRNEVVKELSPGLSDKVDEAAEWELSEQNTIERLVKEDLVAMRHVARTELQLVETEPKSEITASTPLN